MSIQGNAQVIIDSIDKALHQTVVLTDENDQKRIVRVLDKSFLIKLACIPAIAYVTPYVLDFILQLITLFK